MKFVIVMIMIPAWIKVKEVNGLIIIRFNYKIFKKLTRILMSGSSGSRTSRRRSASIQPSPYELPEHSTSPISINRRSSVVDLNRRTSVASNSSSTDLDQVGS